jgi:HSP20 family molecular chaperone IbpA
MAITLWKAPELTYHPWSYIDELEKWAADTWETWAPEYRGTHHWAHAYAYHPYELYEYKDELYLKMELPGYKKEDIYIGLEGDVLTLKAEKKAEEWPKEAKCYYGGRWYGTYTRQWTLPYPVDTGKVTSTYEDGILEIKLPKAEEAKTKKIEITVK